MKKHMTWNELKELFEKHVNSKAEGVLQGCVVFTKDSFDREYSLESRTYLIPSNCKAFDSNMGGYSIYGSSLDLSDIGVRLDQYMAEEYGGKNGWKVDYCYLAD